jgi:hypothetical protein
VTRTSNEQGSAPVDFVLVGSLVILLFLAVLQLGIDVHVRNVLAASVAEGARYGANADVGDAQAGADHANELIASSVGSSFAHAEPAAQQDDLDGQPLVTIRVAARLPLLAWFLPIGPTVTATGHAIEEPR